MAESSPISSRTGVGERRPQSSGDLRSGPPSSPPSEPRPSRASLDALDAQLDRPLRLQMIVALVLVLVLVAIPLYLWRRPRAEPLVVTSAALDAGALPTIPGAPPPVIEDGVLLSAPKIVSCHDPGPKKTPPDRCDHVDLLERAFAKAIEDSASCVPKDAGGGTIIFLLDASLGLAAQPAEVGLRPASNFKRRFVGVSTPREGRTLKSAKIAAACERAVKAKLGALSLDGAKHEHARYRVSITATYPGPSKP